MARHYIAACLAWSLALASALGSGAALGPASAQQGDLISGQVIRVERSADAITIRHGPIPKLGMSQGMTMVFHAQDPAMLKAVKAGDRVKFDAEEINGQFTVTRIEKSK